MSSEGQQVVCPLTFREVGCYLGNPGVNDSWNETIPPPAGRGGSGLSL